MVMTMKSSLRGKALTAAPRRTRVAARASLNVCAFTEWKLEPQPEWCKEHGEECALAPMVSLSGVISDKMKGVLDSEEGKSDDRGAFTHLCDECGVHVEFEGKGLSNPLDSPSSLTIKDLGGKVELIVDGKKPGKDVAVPLKPGSHLIFGKMHFQVVRDVHAHA